MSTHELFLGIQNNSISISIGQANHLFGYFAQLFHIGGLVLIIAPSILINLRGLGVALPQQDIVVLNRITNKFIGFGLVSLTLSGFFMFAPSAALYYPNPAFWLKMQLLISVIVIQLLLSFSLRHYSDNLPLYLKVLCGAGLILWLAVAAAGRAIGYLAA